MPSRSPADLQRDRKRKNADAQAQFRQRRANYISSLEETVTKLEQVVLELQDSLRDARRDASRASDETRHLRSYVDQQEQEYRLKEQEWRSSWQAKLPGVAFPTGASSIPPPSFNLPSIIPPHRQHDLPSCLDPNLRFGHNLKDRPPLPKHLAEGSIPYAFDLPLRQPVDSDNGPPNSSRSPTSYRTGSEGDMNFRSAGPSSLSHISNYRRSEGGFENSSGNSYADSQSNHGNLHPRIPSLFAPHSDLRENVGYDNRSISPHSPHASPSSAATSASSHVHYLPELNHPENIHSSKGYGSFPPLDHAHHAHLSGDGSGESNTRRSDLRSAFSNSEAFPQLPAPISLHAIPGPIEPFPGPSIQRSISFTGMLDPIAGSEGRRRSSSPPVSDTLTLLKAQAFGALRRNRNPKKKSNGYASKVALEALEARGLGLGLEPTLTLASSHDMVDEKDEWSRDSPGREDEMEP